LAEVQGVDEPRLDGLVNQGVGQGAGQAAQNGGQAVQASAAQGGQGGAGAVAGYGEADAEDEPAQGHAAHIQGLAADLHEACSGQGIDDEGADGHRRHHQLYGFQVQEVQGVKNAAALGDARTVQDVAEGYAGDESQQQDVHGSHQPFPAQHHGRGNPGGKHRCGEDETGSRHLGEPGDDVAAGAAAGQAG